MDQFRNHAMDELKKQVGRAHTRMTFQRFLNVLVWTLFACFLVALVAALIPKIRPIAIDAHTWTWGWLGGTAIAGFLIAFGWTLATRTSRLEAAIELDQRFGLKERVSSTLALSEAELETEAGQALLTDATRRVAQVEVAEKFQGQPKWWNLLPVVPALAIFLITVLIPDAVPQKNATAAASTETQQRVERTAESLKKKLAERKKIAEAQGLKEANALFSKIEKGVDDMKKLENVDRKKALVKLNNLADQIKQRRNTVGDPDKLREQFNQMKDLKSGPAERMNNALRKGDMKNAISEIQKLSEKLKTSKLSKKEREQLAEQLQQMSQKLKELTEAHQMAKDELKKQIEQAKASGDRQKAGQLQNKLDSMKQQGAQMSKLNKLAERMSQAAQAAKEGKNGKAAEQMNAIASELSEMDAGLTEMAMLDAALEELESSKDSMNCNNCNGKGCAECQGNSGGNQVQGKNKEGRGQGLGDGQGRGDRPESATASQTYDSKVKAKVGKGKAVVTGVASGPNRSGPAFEEYKEAIRSATIADEDPLTGARIPKEHREQATEYFNKLREGE
jgi:chemotaxis protein histidine kinase CheA